MKRNSMAKRGIFGVSRPRKPSVIDSVVLFCRSTIVLTALLFISPSFCQSNKEGVYDLRIKEIRNDLPEKGIGQYRQNFDDFRSLIHQHFLNDNQYLFLQVMGAVAIDLKATMVAWAKCPGPGDDLVLHRQHQGILLFAYGTEKNTTEKYLAEAFVSARRIKALNPTANITLVTNPGLHPTIDGAFDLVINIKPEYMLPGNVQSWSPSSVPRQWLTRIAYLGRSPYEVTFALDAGALCCSSRVDDLLKQGLQEFDIAFAVQGQRILAPHNWAIMYRLSDNTRRMLKRWRIMHIAKSKTGSDQGTLFLAAGSLALQDKLKVGVISENVAMSLVPYSRTDLPWPKTSRLADPAPILFFHYNALSQEDESKVCGRLNEDTSRARLLFQRVPMSRSEITWEMKYSEAELAEAAKNAHPEGFFYFKDLDWNNSEGKWGHDTTPWQEQYPHCWDDLYEEVNEGVQALLDNPKLRASPAFAGEFADDHIWPI